VTGAVLLAGIAVVLGTAGAVEVVALLAARRRSRGLRPARGVVLLVRLGRGLGPGVSGGVERRVAAAGLDVVAADVMAVKAGAGVVGLAAAVVAAPGAPGRLAPVLLVAAPAAAFLAPDAWLRRRTRARRNAMEGELAGVLDLLRVAVAAGLAPKRALQEVGRRHPGLLAAELRRAAGRAALGAPASQALDDLERRCPAVGIAALVAAVKRAERHGTPLAPALAAQAGQARARRARQATEAAARAAPQIQLVVALLLVPAVLLLVAAALLPAVTGGAR
jgi:tight adherence protein C